MKILAKHISCESECKFMVENVIQIKSEITISVGVSAKNKYVKNILRILLHGVVKMVSENGKYLPSIINDSVIRCD